MSRLEVTDRSRHVRGHRQVRRLQQVAATTAVALALTTACGGGASAPTADAEPDATSTSSAAAQFDGYSSSTYRQDRYWLCRPGSTTTNHCLAASLDSTIAGTDGTTEIVAHEPVAQGSAALDCFFVYPTIPGIDFGPDQLNDLDPLSTMPNKIVVVGMQAARFTETCNVYAPVYRAMTGSGWSAAPDKQRQALEFAYRDVLDAFKHYMANFNSGRPFVLIGHSQGSIHLERLIRDEIDNDLDLRRQFLSGLLIGGTVQTLPDKEVGGSFHNVPLCRTDTETSCVVAFNSYAADPPPDPVMHNVFGHDAPGTVAACTNPAALGGDAGALKPYLPFGVTGVTVTTPYIQVPDALRAVCASGNGMTYLAISPTTAAGDPRNVEAAVTNSGFWGLHLTESNLTQGNLIDLVRSQSASSS